MFLGEFSYLFFRNVKLGKSFDFLRERKKIGNRVDCQRPERKIQNTQEIKRTLLTGQNRRKKNLHVFEEVLFFKLRTT